MWTRWPAGSSCGYLFLDLLLVLGAVLVAGLGGREDDVVDQPVLLRCLGSEEVVALGVQGHLLDLLAGVTGEDLVQLLARAQYLLGVDLDVRRLALHAAPRLVDE